MFWKLRKEGTIWARVPEHCIAVNPTYDDLFAETSPGPSCEDFEIRILTDEDCNAAVREQDLTGPSRARSGVLRAVRDQDLTGPSCARYEVLRAFSDDQLWRLIPDPTGSLHTEIAVTTEFECMFVLFQAARYHWFYRENTGFIMEGKYKERLPWYYNEDEDDSNNNSSPMDTRPGPKCPRPEE